MGFLTEAAICHLQLGGAVAFVKLVVKVTREQLVVVSSSSRSKGEVATSGSWYSQFLREGRITISHKPDVEPHR